jgi:hypothetical protein
MTVNKITEFYTELYCVYPNITSIFRPIAMFKQDNDSNKSCRHVHDFFTALQCFMTCLHKTKYEF